jgi:hypothetical protein
MNAPKTNAYAGKKPNVDELLEEMARMEDLLRFLRDRANNYVPADKLAEIDKFLKP